MKSIRQSALPLVFAASFLGCHTTPDETVIESAIRHRGGAEMIRNAHFIQTSLEGTFREIPFSGVLQYRPPNAVRWDFTIAGQQIVRVFNGKGGYQEHPSGEKVPLSSADTRIVRNQAMDESVFWLVDLDNPHFTIGEPEANTFDDKKVLTVQVSHVPSYVRHLHFDADTLELCGSEGYSWTPFGRLYIETMYSAFFINNGVSLPGRVVKTADGEPYMDAKVIDVRFLDHLSDRTPGSKAP